MKRIACALCFSVLVTAIFLSVQGKVAAESVADFYKKKPVTLVVTYGPGGGTDTAARIMASEWRNVTGGRMIIRNITGAGGIRGMNHMFRAKPDGRTLGYTDSASSLLGAVFFETPGIQFDARKFVYLAINAVVPNGIGISPRLSANSIQDLQKIEGLKFGSHAVDSQAACSALTIEIFGLKNARIVTGFGGMEEEGLALARGEIDAYSNSMHSMTDHIDKKFVKRVVLVYSDKRSSWFPDTPLPTELAELTPEQKRMFTIVASLKSAKPIFAPPGLSRDKTDFLRDAFSKIFNAKGYNEKMKVRFPIMGSDFYLSPAEWSKTVEEALSIPRTERDAFINVVKKYAM